MQFAGTDSPCLYPPAEFRTDQAVGSVKHGCCVGWEAFANKLRKADLSGDVAVKGSPIRAPRVVRHLHFSLCEFPRIPATSGVTEVSVCANRRPPFARPTPNLHPQKLSTLRNVAALAIWFWPRTDHHQPRVAKGSLESAFNTPMSINGPLCHSSRYIPITSPSDSFALQVAVTGLFFQRTSRKKVSPKYRAFLLTHRTRRLIL